MLCCDLGLKAVSEANGHDAADIVLGALITRVDGHRKRADLFGRMAWDELVLVLPGVAARWSWAPYVRHLRRTAEFPVQAAEANIVPSLAIGIHILQTGSGTPTVGAAAAIRLAANDMYRSRRALELKTAQSTWAPQRALWW